VTRVRFIGKRTVPIVVTLIAAFVASGCAFGVPSDLDVSATKTTLRVGETVQLSVIQRLPSGSRDLTSATTETIYYTTGESMLIPEPDGRVTCIGTSERDRESAVIGALNSEHHGSLRFQLLPAGPGPGLEVTADTTVLPEGERVQLRVFKSLPGGGRRDLTPISTGTRYLTLAGNAMVDSSVVSVSDLGLASAVNSIGRFNYRTVIVFVRNGDALGWIVLKVVRAGSL